MQSEEMATYCKHSHGCARDQLLCLGTKKAFSIFQARLQQKHCRQVPGLHCPRETELSTPEVKSKLLPEEQIKNFYTHVDSSFIHNSQKVGATQVYQWMNGKQNVVYTSNKLLFSLKKVGSSDTCYNMGEY